MIDQKRLSIYVHIPFCVKKCDYCDFLSWKPEACEREHYVDLLLREIEECSRRGTLDGYAADTVFFGGGTPSLMESDQLDEILCKLRESLEFCSDAEISLEVNPGTVTYEKLAAYRRSGFNRISIGAQSLQDTELQALGRIHDTGQLMQTWKWITQAGFTNRNLDLMTGIPGQTMESLTDTLQKAIALSPEHISAYSLIIEDGTPFEKRYPAGAVDEDTDREMYLLTGRMLREAGYHRYEISNYARTGYECRHNSAYWIGQDYIGFGVGAASMMEHTRFSNTRAVPWKRGQMQELTQGSQMEEMMFLGLRLMRGVSMEEFEKRYGVSMLDIYAGVIRKHEQEGLLTVENGRLRLTEKGIDVSNYVMADFLLD